MIPSRMFGFSSTHKPLSPFPDQEREAVVEPPEGLPDRLEPGRALVPAHGPAEELRRLQGDRGLAPQARGEAVRPVPGTECF